MNEGRKEEKGWEKKDSNDPQKQLSDEITCIMENTDSKRLFIIPIPIDATFRHYAPNDNIIAPIIKTNPDAKKTLTGLPVSSPKTKIPHIPATKIAH